MALPIEDYALIGNLRTAALVGRDGSIDWLCVPRFDDAACFCALLGTPEHGRWSIAPTRPVRRTRRRYSANTLILETDFETATGSVRIVDFMPTWGERTDVVRIVEGVRGRVSMRMELVLRFGYGNVIPWVRQVDGTLLATAGPYSAQVRGAVETHGEDFRTVAEFMVARGERVPFVITFFPSHLPAPLPIDPFAAHAATQLGWEKWSATMHLQGPVARRRHAFPHHAQEPDLRADRRHRRGADHFAAGTDRGPSQLGLPLLLGTRRHVYALCAAAGRVSG